MTRFSLASLICLCMLTIGVGNVWGDSQTFTKSDINASNTSATKTPITVSIDGTVSVSGQQFRFASGKAMTVTSSSGNITRIDVTTNSTEAYISPLGNKVSSGSWNKTSTTKYYWSGNATSVTLTPNSAIRITQVVVTYSAASCTTNPTVTAGSNSSVTATTATVSCSSGISSLGSAGCSISSYGFVLNTTGTPTISDTKHQVGTTYTTTGTSFSKDLTGLSAETTYYVRPYATNGNGTAYGTQTSFTTPALPKYTVTLMDDGDTRTQASYEASVTLPSRAGCTGYTFAGWTKTWVAPQSSWTTTAPTIIPAGSYTPTANENLYPVYTKTEGGGMVFDEYEKCTTAPDDWTAYKYIYATADDGYALAGKASGGNYGDYASFSTTTEMADYELTLEEGSTGNYKVKQGGKYISCSSFGNLYWVDTYTAKTSSVNNGDWQLYKPTGTAYRIESPVKNSNNKWIYIDYNSSSPRFNSYVSGGQTAAYLYKRKEKSGSTTYYISVPGCCTDPGLAYGTGSVTKTYGAGVFTNTLTNSHSVAVTYSSSDPTVATVNGSGQVTILKAGSTTITASSAAQTVAAVSYCADEASYTLTVNKASISPTLTYTPNSVAAGSSTSAPTVGGNPGSGGVTYAITSASPSGCATINTSTGVVTGVAVGSVTVTATVAATTNYNGGSATANVTITAASGYCISAFNSSNNGITSGFSNGGSGNEYTLSYTIPGKDGSSNWPQYWIGENEAWASFSANALFADMHVTTCDATIGLAEGATGKLHIWDDNKADGSNLWVKFEPSGYGLRWGGADWSQAANTKAFTVDAGDANVYWTDIVTLDGTNNTTWNYYVGLQTASGYVYSGVDNEASDSRGISRTRSVTAMKVSNGTAGSWKGTYLSSEPTGSRGKFRIWNNNIDDYNFYCHWVPFYRVTYDGSGASGSTAASADVCCEGNAAARTVVAAANGFTVPTGKTFGGWASSPENAAAGVVAYAAGANVVLTSSITLYAIWTDINYTVTVNQNPSVGATTTGQTTTAHYGGTINISTTVPDGYRFDGWTASPSVTFASSSSTSTSFTMPASDVTITASFTRIDTYIDNIWNIVTSPKTGTYTRPTLSDQTPGGLTDCQHLHYHFVGWITKAKYDAGTTIDARTTPTGDLVATGSVTADGSTYYAVWEKASSGGISSYTELTDVSELAAGDHIIITDGVDAGMKAWNSSDNNCKEAAITISAGTITSIGDACELTLGGSSGHWTFHDGTYYIYAAGTATTKSNYMKGKTVKDDACEWTITIDGEGVTSVVSVTNDKTPHMQYNSSSSLFSCYNTESQSPVTLFRKPGVTYEDPIATCGEEYTITIDKNNASATCTSCGAKVTANATTLSNLVAPTWTGHDVDYYMVASADNSTKIAEANGALAASVTSGTPWTDSNGKWVKGGDATIYAKWKYAEYEIAYYDQGGSAFSGVHGEDYPTTHTYNTATTLVNPTKNGYNFAGWYTSSDCSTGLVTSLGATAYTSGPINLYAKWTLKTYDVTWVVNGTTVATQTSVTYGTTYEDLSSTPSNPADNALADCGSDKFIGWVTAEYTAEGGTKVSQYDPYAVSNSTMIDDTHHTFYAMFAKESGTAFSLSVTSGDFKISGLVGGVNYYATGALSSGQYGVTTTASDGDLFTFTKVSDGVYTILHKRSSKYVKWNSSTNFKEETTAENWTITAASHGSWCVVPAGATTRAFVMNYSSSNPASNSVFKPYAQTNVTNTPAQYYYVEIGTSNLTNYRTGCCGETITLTVSDATSGAGGTVAMKWNNASKSSGAEVSTCSTGTLVVDVTANPSYTLTAITIAGTNKTITIDPADLTTGLPSTSKMTYTVTVPSLATGTLTITPTFTRTYSVTYNLDGGETAGSTAVVNYQSGATVTLVTPDPTRSGYNFTGWTVTKDGGGNVSVSAGQFTMPTDNVTATAGWAAKTLSSISVAPTTAEVYVGQYMQIPVTYDPADILTKGYTLVSTPGYCVTTGSTNTTLKITGGRGGVTITSTQVETVSIKATADNTKTASVTVTVKPLPVDHFVDLVHGETFADQAASIVDNNLSTAYTAPGHADVDAPLEGNDCEKQHLHLVGWIESEWANAHLTATMSEITSAEDNEHNPLFFEVYAPMNVSGRTYYAVWGKEVTP